MENNKSVRNLVNLIFKAVAVAMGVAVVVLGTMGSLTPQTGMSLLGMGLLALAIAALR
jgi:hypothetical protein